MTKAQSSAPPFSKTFPNGSHVSLRQSSFKETRTRTGGEEAGKTPGRELLVETYSLWLKEPGQAPEVMIWSDEVISDAGEERLTGTRHLSVSDVLLSGDRAYILTRVRGLYGVDNVRRDTDGVWFKSSMTSLARHMEFQPIFKAEFLPKSKPQIFIEYKVGGGKRDGQIRRWLWSLDGECWNRK